MDNAGYTVLNRQIGLRQELQMVANNIANMSTSGFRKEGLIFSEYVHAMEGRDPSLSMARATARTTDLGQGVLSQTGGQGCFAGRRRPADAHQRNCPRQALPSSRTMLTTPPQKKQKKQ